MKTYHHTNHKQLMKSLLQSTILSATILTLFISASVYADDATPSSTDTTCNLNTNQSYKVDDIISQDNTSTTQNNLPDNPSLKVDSEQIVYPEVPALDKTDHKPSIAPWPLDYTINAHLITTAGNIHCKLFAGAHPLTVLNFISLATGTPGWTDASGQLHRTPYYQQLKFSNRVKGAYVLSGLRPEGTDFVIQDERCKTHEPVAGTIAMNQSYPGTASAQFMLMPRKNPNFKNMYPVFGICAPIETIDKITREDAVLERIDIEYE